MALPGGARSNVDEYAVKVYKMNLKDPSTQALPKCWSPKDRSRCLKLSHFALAVTYGGGYSERHDANYATNEAATVRSDVPIPNTTGIYYFEITLTSKVSNGKSFSFGIVTKNSSLAKLPGAEHSSFGYHSDGSIHHGSLSTNSTFGPRITENDTLGCGVDFMSRSLFFTRNGIFLGSAFEGKVPASLATRLYPAVGIQGRGVRLTANFGQRPFCYAFDAHVKCERVVRERDLVDRLCGEEFAGPKMRELVSGYLVHHGYVATAKAFSRWSSVASCPTTSSSPSNCLPDASCPTVSNNMSTQSSDSQLLSSRITSHKEGTPKLPRRHSDTSCCINSPSTMTSSKIEHPGLDSMLHRRRLRALCRRCQYGKAANVLNDIYPQVLERFPDLLVQLRCRQLIEMMRRHAVQTSGKTFSDSNSTSSNIPPKVQKTSTSQHARSSGGSSTGSVNQEAAVASSVHSNLNTTSTNPSAMDLDVGALESCSVRHSSLADSSGVELDSIESDAHADVGMDGLDEDEEFDAATAADEDDDGFGFIDEDTGLNFNVSLSSPASRSESDVISWATPDIRMDVDSDQNSDVPKTPDVSKDELQYLLRNVQFGRSLVNLVKRVREKTGGLSIETERLLQQSVSLIAYSSPNSSDCPLRSLLDPVWRDRIANVINSAVLKAHDLPVQPALEQCLRLLHRCFQDQYLTEAQTVGHFLLYHLSPSQLAEAEQEAARLAAQHGHSSATKRQRSNSRCLHESSGSTDSTHVNTAASSNKSSTLNGHTSRTRRARIRGMNLRSGDASNSDERTIADAEEFSASSVEDALNKDEDEEHAEDLEDEDDEDSNEDRCHLDDINENFSDDDDDDGVEPESNPTNPTSVSTTARSRSGRFPPTSASSQSTDQSPNDGGDVGSSSSSRAHRVRSFFPFLRTNTDGVTRLNRPTVLRTNYCPTFYLDPTHNRLLAAIPSPSLHVCRSDRSSSMNSSTSSRTYRPTADPPPPNQYLDSHFSGLLSASNPRRVEFLAAVNEALKNYANSLYSTNDDLSTVSLTLPTELHRHHHHDGGDDGGPQPPPAAGGNACA